VNGVFDKHPEARRPAPAAVPAPDPLVTNPRKEDFKDVSQQHADMVRKREDAGRQDSIEKAIADSANAPVGIQNVQSELDDLEKISEADLALAEMLIFKGYAETEISMCR
jgi:hypothetical protein